MRKSASGYALGLVLAALMAGAVYSQGVAPTNSLPNPYRSIENWARFQAIRADYKRRFDQQSVGLVINAACADW